MPERKLIALYCICSRGICNGISFIGGPLLPLLLYSLKIVVKGLFNFTDVSNNLVFKGQRKTSTTLRNGEFASYTTLPGMEKVQREKLRNYYYYYYCKGNLLMALIMIHVLTYIKTEIEHYVSSFSVTFYK